MMIIEKITLNNGVEMPLLGLGTYTLQGSVLDNAFGAAYDAGYRLFDTAVLYGNEENIGAAIVQKHIDRKELFLVSKVNETPLRGRKRYFHLNKKSVAKCYEQSCKRLKTDYLDAYLLHHCDARIEEYAELVNLYKAGKVRAVGLCNISLGKLQEFVREVDFIPQLIQVQIHPYYTKNELVRFAQDNGIACEAHTQFGRGNIDLRSDSVLCSIAKTHKKNVNQIILRWLMQRHIISIPRSSNPQHIVSNIDLFDFALTKEEMAAIDALNRNESYCSYDKP